MKSHTFIFALFVCISSCASRREIASKKDSKLQEQYQQAQMIDSGASKVQ